jgi:hypothetical protein
VGSRFGTHAIWTLSLSAAISLLALSPIVLPGGAPLDRLPGPLAGVERVGRVVVGALAPPAKKKEPAVPAEPVRVSPPVPEAGAGVLAERTGGTRAQPRREPPRRPHGPERPAASALSPRPQTPRELTKAEIKAERRAETVAARAERKEQKAEATATRRNEKEHGHGRIGSSAGHGKKSDKARDTKGGGQS